MKPEITHVSEMEGGRWVSWAEWRARPVPCPKGKRIHAWKLSDGTVWDAYGGLRPEHMWEKPIDGTGWAEAAFNSQMTPTEFNDAMRKQMAATRRVEACSLDAADVMLSDVGIYRLHLERANRMPDNDPQGGANLNMVSANSAKCIYRNDDCPICG